MITDTNEIVTKSLGKRLLNNVLVISGILLVLFMMTGLGLLLVQGFSGKQLTEMNNSINEFGFLMQFIRWGIYLLLYLFWQPVIKAWGRLRHWNDAVIQRAILSRLSTILILLAVELFLIQRIHLTLFSYFAG